MLPRQYRLHLRTERNRVTATGKTLHSTYFTVITTQNTPPYGGGDQEGVSRYAVITSTKLHPHSVERHRLKRQIHQILQENLSSLPPGRDVIIIPKKTILTVDKSALSSDLLNLLKV